MLKRILPVMLACALLAAAGCDTMKSTWKGTRKAYKEYINVDPTIDLKDPGISDPTQQKLARLFTPVDERLEFLLRDLSSKDTPPDREWCEAFAAHYSWLSGLVVLNGSGSTVMKFPSFGLKTVDLSPMMEFEKSYKKRRMAAVIASGDLGAEIVIAQPLFTQSDFQGLLVAHFDSGSLAKFSPEPEQLFIIAPGAVVWPGGDAGTAKALASIDWKKMLLSNVSGEVVLGQTKYLWQARYIAQAQIVYAVSAVPASAKVKPAEPAAEPAAAEPATVPAAVPGQ